MFGVCYIEFFSQIFFYCQWERSIIYKIGDFDIPAYKSPDEGLTDFYYTYCFFEKNFAMYRYDSRENVLQRCPEFTLGDISAAAPKGAGFAARFASLSSNAKIIDVSYTHFRAYETPEPLVCRLLLEKKMTISA